MADSSVESTTIIPGKAPADILTKDGEPISESGARLDSIFSLAEQGKPIKEAIAEAMADKPAVEEEKKEVVAPKEEEKVEPPVETGLDKKLSDRQEKKDSETEVSRENLRKQTEAEAQKQAAESAKDKPEIKDEAKPDPDAVPEDELKVLPYDKPKTAKRIQALLKKIDSVNTTYAETKKQAEEKATKLAELEKQLGEVKTVNPEVAEQIKKQQDELAMFRRRYELDKDPSVKTRFDSRAETAEKTITDVLTRRNAGEALLSVIKEEGGWAKFSESNRLLPINNKDGGTDQVPASELADRILGALPLGERKRVEAAMLEQIQTASEKARFFEEETKKASEFFKQRDEEVLKAEEANRKAFSEVQKTVEDFQRTAFEKNEWLKEKDIPATLPPEQKQALEEDNRYTKQLQSLFKQALSTKDVPGMLAIVMDSVAYYNERRTTARLSAENARLQAEIKTQKEAFDKFRNAAKSTLKGGSLHGGGSSSSAPAKAKAALTLEEQLTRIESGQRPGSEDNDE